jgi:hypothetical protein
MKHTKADFNIDNNGVIRWNSSGNVPPADILAEFLAAGMVSPEEVLRSTAMKEEEDTAFLRAYIARRQKTGYSEEEMYEMRAAFGPGETVVDMFTGQEITL